MTMKKMILTASACAFIALTGIGAHAQDTDKKDEKKSEPTTLDAWRGALPANEQPAYQPTTKIVGRLNNDPDSEETPAEIEQRVLALEARFLKALNQRKPEALNKLIADDFVIAGVNIPGAQSDKGRFIDWTQKQFNLKSYTMDRPTVHTYATAAVVSYNYKRQASVGNMPADGDFTVTDVWVKNNDQWQLVSHHISPLPKL